MILLINPKISKSSETHTEFLREPNLGILYLAAILDLNDIAVDILDLQQYTDLEKSELTTIIKKTALNYRIFGITSLTNTFYRAVEIAKIIKKQDENNFVILGGPHVSFMFKEILEKYGELIDFICIGEAEVSFIKLVKILLSQNQNYKNLKDSDISLKSIKGLAFNDLKGNLIVNDSSYIQDIENLPLPARYKLIPENYYYTVANVIVNRGCPNQCSFCSRQKLFKRTRIRSIESILNEIRDIISMQNYTYINFYDNININQDFFRKFCEMFIENNINIPWGCELRVDTINAEKARLLKDAGCRLIATGIESADETVLKTNFKYQDPEQVRTGIINLKKNKIAIQAYFVLGLPGETQHSFYQTIKYIKSLPLDETDQLNYFVATPYPGSRLWDEKEYFCIKIFENDFTKYDCNHIIFETKELNKEILEELYNIAKKIETEYYQSF